MALSHSILATLVGLGKPCSGYDLAKEFNSSVGFYWKTTHQQIYRELSRLDAENMVSSELVRQTDRPDKKVYTVTDSGMEHLIDWIGSHTDPTPIKEDLLVKMFVGFLVPKEVLIEELERRKLIHQNKLKLYNEYEKKYFHDIKALSLKGKYRYLNLRSGIGFETNLFNWCEEAIQFLNNEVE